MGNRPSLASTAMNAPQCSVCGTPLSVLTHDGKSQYVSECRHCGRKNPVATRKRTQIILTSVIALMTLCVAGYIWAAL